MTIAIMRDDELLKQRLDDATSQDNKWNGWPDLLEIVSYEVYDPTDPRDMHTLGWLVGNANVRRQVAYKQFPAGGYSGDPMFEVKIRLPKPENDWQRYNDSSLISVSFGFCTPHGQEDDITKRNINAIFDVHTKYSSLFKRNEFTSHGLVVTIGCKHEYSDAGSNHQPRLPQGPVPRCGHRYMVDSGD